MKKCQKIRSVVSLVLVGSMLFMEGATANADRSVKTIEKDVANVKEEIEGLDDELYQVVLQVQELTDEITTLEGEIEETKEALNDITIACNDQYASMKVRIQYMYERQNESVFAMLMGSKSIAEFLNKVEYVNSVYNYDREKLEGLQILIQEMEELEAALEEEEAELSAAKQDLQVQQSALNKMLDEKKTELADLNKELAKAKEKAKKEAERKAREAAARRAAQRAAASGQAQTYGNVGGDLNPDQTTGINGADVVAYANQFVGNRYVWGGTSLTDGCDCSGFVQSVYRNFGISWGSRMTSVSFRTVGQEVSYSHMQAGDIVCYSGHVGIYMGNGKIVEAQSVATGITNYRNADCKTILTIRRVI